MPWVTVGDMLKHGEQITLEQSRVDHGIPGHMSHNEHLQRLLHGTEGGVCRSSQMGETTVPTASCNKRWSFGTSRAIDARAFNVLTLSKNFSSPSISAVPLVFSRTPELYGIPDWGRRVDSDHQCYVHIISFTRSLTSKLRKEG